MIKCTEIQSCLSCVNGKDNIWHGLDAKHLALLNEYKVESHLAPRQMLFHETHRCHGLHCIADGLLALRKTDDEGNSVILRLVHPGESLGFPAFFGGMNYTAAAEALSPCRVCFFPKRAIDEVINKEPQIRNRFMRLLADELKHYGEARLSTATRPLQERMIALLLEMESSCGRRDDSGALLLKLPISRRDIAAMLGIRPETVARTIRHLADANLAHFKGREVCIPKPFQHHFEAR
jgi:CRP-like cAMP-binding protein